MLAFDPPRSAKYKSKKHHASSLPVSQPTITTTTPAPAFVPSSPPRAISPLAAPFPTPLSSPPSSHSLLISSSSSSSSSSSQPSSSTSSSSSSSTSSSSSSSSSSILSSRTSSAADKLVRLNIGGYRYTTTLDTLVQVGKSHFFSALLGGGMNPTLDDEGAYFVDRNGKYFEPLLDYLRTGILDIPPTMSRAHVIEQALFFGIDVREFSRDLMSEISQRQLTLIVNGLGAGKLQLPGYNLQDRSFAYLDLTNAILTGAVLTGADFREATLTRCDLRGADLEGCNFSHANLKGAKIKGANMVGANLSHAYLQGADLREAKLTNANLQNADLQNANLSGAVLDNVHVKGARFRGCEGISGISLMCAQCGNMYQPAHNNRRVVCPATLGSHFPAEVQPFECDDLVSQPASPPPERSLAKKSFLSTLFPSMLSSHPSTPTPLDLNSQVGEPQQPTSPPSPPPPSDHHQHR